MAFDVGGRGDGTFNDLAVKGLEKDKADMGADIKELSPKEDGSDRADLLRQLADDGYNPIVGVGFSYGQPIDTVAKEYPDVNFIRIDGDPSSVPNVAVQDFAEHEGSFLVGAAAALKSKSKHIGFIGGNESALITKFWAGYEQGAKAVNPSIKIDVKYLTQPPDFSGFNSVDKGKAAADGMYQGGADVVYHAAGGSGGGVFTAAKAAGKWAIGVDSDQAKTAPADVRDVILTSMIKKVDVGVFDFITSVKDNTFKAGNKIFDLKAGGVDYSTTGGHIDDIKSKLDEYKQKIISGEITVPKS